MGFQWGFLLPGKYDLSPEWQCSYQQHHHVQVVLTPVQLGTSHALWFYLDLGCMQPQELDKGYSVSRHCSSLLLLLLSRVS